jgi:type IV secretory pathway TrbL component
MGETERKPRIAFTMIGKKPTMTTVAMVVPCPRPKIMMRSGATARTGTVRRPMTSGMNAREAGADRVKITPNDSAMATASQAEGDTGQREAERPEQPIRVFRGRSATSLPVRGRRMRARRRP